MAFNLWGVGQPGSDTLGVFALTRDMDSAWWYTVTPAWEAYNAAHIASYAIAATETGTGTGVYTATNPDPTTAARALLIKKAGASMVQSDLANGIQWEEPVGFLPVDLQTALTQPVTLDVNNALNVSAKYWAGAAITATSIPVATAAGAPGGLLISGSNSGTTTLGALTVTGATTLTGAVSTGSTLTVTGATSFGSTFAIHGATTLDSTLTVTGAVALSSTLSAGATTLNALTVTNATTLSGAVSLGSTLTVSGATSLQALGLTTLTASGAVALQSTLTVSGATTLAGVNTTGTVTFNNFTVTNTAQFGVFSVAGNVNWGGNFVVAGTLSADEVAIANNFSIGSGLLVGSGIFGGIDFVATNVNGKVLGGGVTALTGVGVQSDLRQIKGTTSAGTAGYVGLDWSAINAPSTAQNLSSTSIAFVSSAVTTGNVTLAAAQPLYAPAKAGDAMTLTSAYDAAKTAAPASTALSTAQWTNTLATNLGTLAGHDPGATLASQTNITAGAITTVGTVNALATNALTTASLTDGLITDAKFTLPAETAGTPTGFMGLMQWVATCFGWRKFVRNDNDGTLTAYLPNGSTVKTTSTFTSVGNIDTINKAT